MYQHTDGTYLYDQHLLARTDTVEALNERLAYRREQRAHVIEEQGQAHLHLIIARDLVHETKGSSRAVQEAEGWQNHWENMAYLRMDHDLDMELDEYHRTRLLTTES